MATKFESILNKIASNPKRLFLMDGLGAFLSAFFLGVVLANFEFLFGMPLRVLYFLSIIACFYALFSAYCYCFVVKNERLYLTIIASANLIYCCLTVGLILYFHSTMTILGLVYFILELILICCLVLLELTAISKNQLRQR